MAIVTALAIKADIHGYCDRTGHRNRHQMQGTCSKVASGTLSTLVSSMRKSPRLSLVFFVAVFPWLGTLYCVVTFLVTVEISDMTQVLLNHASNVGSIDTSG